MGQPCLFAPEMPKLVALVGTGSAQCRLALSGWLGGLVRAAVAFTLWACSPLCISFVGEDWDLMRFLVVLDCDNVLGTPRPGSVVCATNDEVAMERGGFANMLRFRS